MIFDLIDITMVKDVHSYIDHKKNDDYNWNKTKYNRINDYDDGNEFVTAQFEKPEREIPWKAISLASFLLIAGTFTILISCLTMCGYLNIRPADNILVLLFLGLIMFIPGYYHCRIAYYSYIGSPGFSYDDIPSFD